MTISQSRLWRVGQAGCPRRSGISLELVDGALSRILQICPGRFDARPGFFPRACTGGAQFLDLLLNLLLLRAQGLDLFVIMDLLFSLCWSALAFSTSIFACHSRSRAFILSWYASFGSITCLLCRGCVRDALFT